MHGAHSSPPSLPPSLPPPLLPPVVFRPSPLTTPSSSSRRAISPSLDAHGPHHPRRVRRSPLPLHPGLASTWELFYRPHSECFTGETVGSQRCDCGEQLDEAIRRIARAARGAVVYLRQEGRGIGLLSKLRAYNLQDIGHDTVAANLLLGHRADERAYDIAGAILRDLGLADGVRVLTNNPDKVAALESEGMRVVERVPMVPRSWQARSAKVGSWPATPGEEEYAPAGATLIGGGAVHGEDLDKYLRTKVLKMGHMLPLWMDGALVQ
ncbi:GTP cyclohydrolase II-domain-containing protein [Schizophyllum commune]